MLSKEQVQKLQQAYKREEYKNALDVFSTRKYLASVLTVSQTLEWFSQKGFSEDKSYRLAKKFFRLMEEIGIGKYIEGRWGRASRFRASVPLKLVGLAAQSTVMDEVQVRPEIPTTEPGQDVSKPRPTAKSQIFLASILEALDNKDTLLALERANVLCGYLEAVVEQEQLTGRSGRSKAEVSQ